MERVWWNGPLDVEGLALDSVDAAARALGELTGDAGRFAPSAPATAAAFDSLGHLRVDGRVPRRFAPLSGFWPTRDGWIRTHGNYPHHARRMLAALRVDGAAALLGPGADAGSVRDAAGVVGDALLRMTAVDAERSIQSRGGIAAAVRSPDEWSATRMAQDLAGTPWLQVTPAAAAGRTGETLWHQRPHPDRSTVRPLSGLRVLDFTRVIAGPIATRLLAALGAQVLRIDPPQLPDLLDQHIDAGFGKRSAYADLANPRDRAAVLRLVQSADVVVTGYRPGALRQFGLDEQSLLAARPELIVASLDAWGRSGPWGRLRGFDSIVQAASGIATIYGHDDGSGWRPGALPCQALDHATGYGVAAGIIELLARQAQSGLGGAVHLALARTAAELLARQSVDAPVSELDLPATRTMDSEFGPLAYTPPPLLVDGELLDYTAAPVPPGSSPLSWW